MLNEMRMGTLSAKSVARFKALDKEVQYKDGLDATELCVSLAPSPQD